MAARRISRSCVVAAGLVARGDTRTEERDVRGYLGRHGKALELGGKK